MDFLGRRIKFASYLSQHSVLLLHSGKPKHRSQDSYFPYEVSRNFYYLTGLRAPSMTLLLHKQSKISTLNSYLFMDAPDPIKAKWDGAMMTKEEASIVSGIEVANIKYNSEFDAFFQQLTVHSRSGVEPVQSVYLDLFRLKGGENVEAFDASRDIQQTYPELKIDNANSFFASLRSIKSSEEIKAIEMAIGSTYKALQDVWSSAKAASTEADVYADFTASVIRQATRESFNTIVAAGNNATILHYHENNQPIDERDLVLTDCGTVHELYNADITRTWPKSGVFSKRQKELYQLVLDVNKACIQAAKPGLTWQELNALAKDRLAKGLVKLGVMKSDDQIGEYYYHSIGHHLGLDVHDAGVYSTPLVEGNVITIEPGIYIAKDQLGIRIEDDIVITKTGSKNLSSMIPKEIDELEAFFKSKKK
jgi:Xaa-Pro aminopeptidase